MSEPSVSQKQHFHLGDFDGPLDLLLFLIRSRKSTSTTFRLPPSRSSTSRYLNFATKVDLDTMTEFYLMAATLLYIKSKMLLPVELNMDDEIEDPRRDLVEKLIEYQKFRKLSDLMAQKEGEVEWIIERTRSQRILPFSDEGIWDQVSVWDLLQTFSSLLTSLSSERIIDLYEEVSVNEKVTLIAELLEEREEFLFTELVKRRSHPGDRMRVLGGPGAGEGETHHASCRTGFSGTSGSGRGKIARREQTEMELSKDAALIEAVLLLESDPVELRKLASISGPFAGSGAGSHRAASPGAGS